MTDKKAIEEIKALKADALRHGLSGPKVVELVLEILEGKPEKKAPQAPTTSPTEG